MPIDFEELIKGYQKNSNHYHYLIPLNELKRLFVKRHFFRKSYWNLFYDNSINDQVEVLFATQSGIVFVKESILGKEPEYGIMFYNPNPVTPVYLIKFKEIDAILTAQTTNKALDFQMIDPLYHFYQTDKRNTIHYKTTNKMSIPIKSREEIEFLNEVLSKLKNYESMA